MDRVSSLLKKFSLTPWESILVLVLLSWGLALRAYHPDFSPFGFDQVQILENAEAIAQGDLRLIGPRTGPAAMFTGPLIYYVTAAWWLLWSHPYALVGTSLTLAFATGLGLWVLARRYGSEHGALLLLAGWAFSPFLILLDRTPWNPNLMVLAAALVFLPQVALAQAKKVTLRQNWPELGFIALGSWLGYQAHFTGLLLPIFVGLPFLLQPRRWWSAVAASGVGLALSLLPTAVFDLRHNWLNLRGFWELIGGDNSPVSTAWYTEVGRTLFIMIETIGKHLAQGNHPILLLSTGLLILGGLWLVREAKPFRHTALIVGSWLGGTLLIFSLYHGAKPEYYFLLLSPLALWALAGLGVFLWRWPAHSGRWLGLLGLIGLYSTALTWSSFHRGSGLMIGNQVAAADYIQAKAQHKELGPLVYDLQPVESVGLRFLLREYQPVSSAAAAVHLHYPAGTNSMANFFQSGLSVWIDSREPTKTGAHLTKEYLLRYPLGVSLYQPLEYVTAAGNESYTFFDGSNRVGTLTVVTSAVDKEYFDRLWQQYDQAPADDAWRHLAGQPDRYVKPIFHYLLLWEPDLSNTVMLDPLQRHEWLEGISLDIDEPEVE